MTATLEPVWSPADFASRVEELSGNPAEVWSRFGFAVVEMPDDGGQVVMPWAPLASRGRSYRGTHRYNRFRRRGLTVDDVRASL